MGPGARPAAAGVSRNRPQRPGARAALRNRTTVAGRKPARGGALPSAPPAQAGAEALLRRLRIRGGRPKSETDIPANPTRAGFVAVIGAPNAGKSTLVNRLTGTRSASSAQGADDPRPGSRHSHRGADADRLHGHPRAVQAAPAARPRHGRGGVGRGGGSRPDPAFGGRRPRPRRGHDGHRRAAQGHGTNRRHSRPQQGRHRRQAETSRARRYAESGRGLFRRLHDFGGNRQRRRRSSRLPRRADARRSLAVPRGSVSDMPGACWRPR